MYAIWYGNWGADRIALGNEFLSLLGGSDWFGIVQGYYQNIGGVTTYCSGQLHPAMSIQDAYSLGTAIIEPYNIVLHNMEAGLLPRDPDGIYLVLTSADVSVVTGDSTYCDQFCGFHSYFHYNTDTSRTHYRYAFAGDTARCLDTCAEQVTVSPNNDPGMDGTISVMAHELAEVVTDPDIDAWLENTGLENAGQSHLGFVCILFLFCCDFCSNVV